MTCILAIEGFPPHNFYGNILSIKFGVWLGSYIINDSYSKLFLIGTEIIKIFNMNYNLYHKPNSMFRMFLGIQCFPGNALSIHK